MKGGCASFARRRAISVLPTPVGPIIRMFFGTTSSRIPSGSCWRRQRLRKAMATARLAWFWPTMKRSSSETISRGERFTVSVVGTGRALDFQRFQHDVAVGVDADVAGDPHGAAADLLGGDAFHRGEGA